jgi:hypothetical protein
MADAADGVELGFDVVDAQVDLAAIGLELGFARATGSDAAASSTWSWPSLVLAWRAKMSRMSCERSMTWQGSRDSMLRSCEGVRSWSKRTSEALVDVTISTSSSSLP